MRPVSGAALAVAALLTSPALSAAASGAMPVDVALTRYLLAAGLCWVLLSVAEEWLWPAAGTASPSAPDLPTGSAPEPVSTPVPDPIAEGAPEGVDPSPEEAVDTA
jgi:hypothetical protein